ncbi:MAG: hypothetical protein HY788_03890 [Deltaproteobacteria bacterium]|nr:hypothetical protein [Deltaproteobacteria bacterium]
MHEYRPRIIGEKDNNEAGFIRLIVTICLVAVTFTISFWVMQSLRHRLVSTSLMDRLPLLLILLVGCVVVFAYARFRRGRPGSKDPAGETDQDPDEEKDEEKD